MKKIKIIPLNEKSLLSVNIEKASAHIPEWYKNSPQKIKNFENFSLIPDYPLATTSTYKKCSPFLDALINGYIFYLSQDIEVIKKEDGSPYILWRQDLLNPITTHSNEQWEGLQYPENCYNYVYKWENYFSIKTPKGYSCILTQPFNRTDLPFITTTGVMDTDSWGVWGRQPFALKKDFEGIIPAGTPIIQVIPFKRESWNSHIDDSLSEHGMYEDIRSRSKIRGYYKAKHWSRKEYK